VVRGRSIEDEFDPRSANTQEIGMIKVKCFILIANLDCLIASYLEDPDSHMAHYVILRGIDRFFTEYNVYPGHFDERLEPDIVELKVKFL